MHPRGVSQLVVASLIIVSGLLPAHADAIDGHWCHSDGRCMSIDGPKFVTPGGTGMTGDYDRHGSEYVAPDGEPGAGSLVTMELIDEDTILLRAPGTENSENWQRCELTM